MDLKQAIALIQCKEVVNNERQTWADLGCGSGLFTNALAHLLKDESKILAVDKDVNAFKPVHQHNRVVVEKLKTDFVHDKLDIEALDGIMMANSLHYVDDRFSFIKKIEKCMKVSGCFLIVEYDTDSSNRWVPYPISFHSLHKFFEAAGYSSVNKINETHSRFQRARIYSALVRK